jgi:hypothetical protein
MGFELFRRIGTTKGCCDSCINSYACLIDDKSAKDQLELDSKSRSPMRMKVGKKSNFSHTDREERFDVIADTKQTGVYRIQWSSNE